MSNRIFPTAQDAENAFYEALERADRARVVAVRAPLQAMKQREQPPGCRIAGEIDVDEIAVGRLPALARERKARGRAQRSIEGLQVPARQPPRGNIRGIQ